MCDTSVRASISQRNLAWFICFVVFECYGVSSLAGDRSGGPLGEAFDLQGFLDNQVAAGKTRIIIPPGRYRVTPHKGEHLHLHGLQHVELIADGVEMICTETVRALTLVDCRNVTLRGLTIDYDPLPFTQGRIVKLSEDSMTHEIELFNGFPESGQIESYKYEIFRSDTRTLRYGSYYEFEIERLSPRRIKITKGDRYGGPHWHLEKVGDIIVISASHVLGERLSHAVVVNDSTGITLEDVTLYASNCFGFVENNCEGTTYRRCRIDRRPPEKDLRARAYPRIRSLNADAFHSISATIGPSYLECFARFQGDDCINIHGAYHLVMGCRGEQLRVLAKHRLDLKPGDLVELITYSGLRLPDAKIVRTEPDGEIQSSERDFLSGQRMHPAIRSGEMVRNAYRVTLNRPVDLPRGSLIAAINRMGNGFRVVGCDFGFNRSRGILIKASHGEISGNRLQECWMEAIKVAPEFWWLESGSSNNVTITHNRIRSCQDVAIAVYAQANSGDLASAGLHNNISIIGNQISVCPLPGIVVTSTKELELSDNSLDPNVSLPMSPSTLGKFLIEMREPVVLRNVDKVRGTDITIHLAASIGNPEHLRELIKTGADVNSKDVVGHTPLYYAAANGHQGISKLLIAEGANINGRNVEGQTPVDIAISRNQKEIVELLIAKGADISLHAASRFGDLAIVKSLIKKADDINAKDASGCTALHSAVEKGHKDIIKLLIANGADVNAEDNDGNTPVHVALGKNNRPILELLIANGADIDSIHLSAYQGDLDKVKSFIEKGVDINATDSYGATTLRYAVERGDKEVVEFLVARGANVNAKDRNNNTPLHTAAGRENKDIVKLLINNDADINARGQWGYTPIYSAAWSGITEMVDLLVKNGADVNVKDVWGWTPLHYMAQDNYKDIAEFLIAKGADVNAEDNGGQTPLQVAKEKGHTEIVDLLQKHMLVHDVAITDVSVPLSCNRGDIVPVEVDVANQGAHKEAFRVILNDQTSNEEIASEEVTLAKGWKDRSEDDADLIFDSPASGKQYFGYPVVCGDVNGDGYEDLLATASQWNNAQGRAYLYYGGKNMDTIPDMIFTGETAGDLFGDGGAALGDVNGDHYDDVLVGAPGYKGGAEDGRVYIYYSGPDMDDNADLILEGESGEAGYFGVVIVTGDLNKDGYNDAVVSSNKYKSYKGRVYFYYGGEVMDNICDITFDGENTNDMFGRKASIGGDVNGDGYPDLILGARRYPGGQEKGRAYLFYGGNPMDNIQDKIFTGVSNKDRFGEAVSLFDIDNNGLADIVIGAWGYNAGSCQGRVYLYWGEADIDATIADRTFTGELGKTKASFGNFIWGGYVNNDNYGDLLIAGAGYYNGDQRGRAYIYYGGTETSMDEVANLTFTGESPGNCWYRVTLGDVDNDGCDDAIIGGYNYNGGQGRVWLYYGGPSKSTQLKFDWDTTTATLGKHTLRATIAPVTGEKNTADNSMTVEVEVKASSQ